MKLPTPEEAKKLRTGDGLIEFLTHAVRAEREACAKIADDLAEKHRDLTAEVAQAIAARIRARTS